MLQHPAMNYVKQMFASDLVTDFLHLIHPQVLKRVLKLTYSEHFLNHFLGIIVFTKRLFLLPRQHWLLFVATLPQLIFLLRKRITAIIARFCKMIKAWLTKNPK